MGTSHWFQNKDKVVFDDEGMILCDFVYMNILMAMGKYPLKNYVPLHWVKQESARGVLIYRRVHQSEEQGKKEIFSVGDFDEAGNDGKFIKLSDILDSAWDSPELCKPHLFQTILYLAFGQIC